MLDQNKLNEIETRWSRASSGPWTVVDYTCANDDVRDITFSEALAKGMTPSAEAWIEMIESIACEGLTYEQVADSCLLVVPATPSRVAIEDREQDRMLDGCEPLVAPTPPMFAVLGETQDGRCSQEDLQFVLHASVDVGLLLQHAREQQDVIDALRSEIAKLRGA